MMNIMKSNYYKIIHKKAIFGSIAVLVGYILLLGYLEFFTKSSSSNYVTGMNSLVMNVSSSYLMNVLFVIITIKLVIDDYSTGAIKNIFGRGIDRVKYFVGNIISISILYVIVWIVFTFITSLLYSIKYGIGTVQDGETLFLGLLMNLLFMIAIITIISAMVVITKSVMSTIIGTAIILNISSILMIIFSFLKIKINVNFIDMTNYLQIIESSNPNNRLLTQGLLVALVYIIIFVIIGSFIIKKQDVK